jgi:hypothetical protein
MNKTISLIICVSFCASTAWAKPSLRQDPTVWNGLLSIGIAQQIGEKCTSIRARKIKAGFFLLSLQSHAKGLGYSSDEISDFVNDKTERSLLESQTYSYLDTNGVDRTDPQSFCQLGKREINLGSQIGVLLNG